MESPTEPNLAQVARGIMITVVVAVVLTEITGLVIELVTHRTFQEVTPVEMAISPTLTTVLGGIFYAVVVSRLSWAPTLYRILVAAVVVILSLGIILFPPHSGFAILVVPLHLVVGVSSIVLIPRLLQPANSVTI